jgi:hypothetical protein
LITKFNEYINESLRDQMKPVSDKDVEKIIREKDGIEKLRAIRDYNLWKFVTQNEIQEIYDKLSLIDMIDLDAEVDNYEGMERTIKNHYDKKDEAIHDFDMLPLYAKIAKAYDISTIAVQWNNDAFDDLVEELFGHDVFSGKKGDLNVSEVLEQLSDKELVILYGVLLDKINNLPND